MLRRRYALVVHAARAFLLAALLGAAPQVAHARGTLQAGDSVKALTSAIAELPGGGKLCVESFSEEQDGASALRTRFLLPADRPWVLITAARAKETAGCDIIGNNRASLVAYDGKRTTRALALGTD